MSLPIHVKIKKEDLSPRVIAVGDPARSQALAEALLENPRVVNTNRGFLSYTGKYKGKEISIVTHGIGMPSAAIVFEELSMIGAKKIIRLGTTGALRKDINIGDIIIATSAGHIHGGTIGQYAGEIEPGNGMDPHLTVALIEGAKRSGKRFHVGPVISSDAFYAEGEEETLRWSKLGFLSVEMECSVLAALGWMRGFKPACMLLVTDNLAHGEKGIIGTEKVNEIMREIGSIAADALVETD